MMGYTIPYRKLHLAFALIMLPVLQMQVTTAAISRQQNIYEGLILNFTCNVNAPFIQVDDHSITSMGRDGYTRALHDMGIEAQNVSGTTVIQIPRVVIYTNGSAADHQPDVNVSCQEYVFSGSDFVPQPVFTLTLSFRTGRDDPIPAPEDIQMNGTVLTWSPPPSVSRDDSFPPSVLITVSHTLTYRVSITIGTSESNISVSVTFYDLAELLEPCRAIRIQVSAYHPDAGEGERAHYWIFTPGCVTATTYRFPDTTACACTPCSNSSLETELGVKIGEVSVAFITAVVCSLVFCASGCVCGIISVCVYNHMRRKKKQNNSLGQQRPPVYEEVWEPGSVEMNENVAYGPIKKTSM